MKDKLPSPFYRREKQGLEKGRGWIITKLFWVRAEILMQSPRAVNKIYANILVGPGESTRPAGASGGGCYQETHKNTRGHCRVAHSSRAIMKGIMEEVAFELSHEGW